MAIVLALGITAVVVFFVMQSNADPKNKRLAKDYFDSEIEYLTSLAISASSFQEIAMTNYGQAILTMSTEQGMRKLHHFDTRMLKATQSQIGWTLFFNSAVKVYAGGDVKAPIVGYYNPYNDLFLITAWSEEEGGYKIADAELLMGDFIRNEDDAIDVMPLWLRGEMHRPEALGRSVALSLLAFERVFNEAITETWRNRLPILADQDDLSEINYTLAALRLNEHLINILSFSYVKTSSQQLAGCKAATIETINVASDGDIDKILMTADGTLKNTDQRLKGFAPEWFVTLRVAMVLDAPNGSLVLLSSTRPTNSSLAISYTEADGKFQAKRIDLVDYQYCYNQIKALQGAKNEGDAK